MATTIPKALAMANPKHVVACAATVAGLISSKFAIDAVYDEKDVDDKDDGWVEIKRPGWREPKRP